LMLRCTRPSKAQNRSYPFVITRSWIGSRIASMNSKILIPPDAFESSLNAARKQAIMAGTPYIITKQFPWKLHEMLDVVEQRGETSVVSWLPGGRAFRVHNPALFVDQIMKKCFNQTKYKSFQRQLNLWGFERVIRASAEKGSYFHPLFLRGRRDLCQEMARQKVKGEKPKQDQQYDSQGQALISVEDIKSGQLNRRKLPTTNFHAPKGGMDCVSTDDSTASSVSSASSPPLTSSLLLASLPPHQLLNQPLAPSGFHNPLHVLKALQSSTTNLPPSAIQINTTPAGAPSSMVRTCGVSTPDIATTAVAAGFQLQQQQSSVIRQRAMVENVLLLKALENQDRASSIVLAAALLGNLARPR